MKRWFVILLCLLLAGLCACGQAGPEETSAGASIATVKETTKKEYSTTGVLQPLPNNCRLLTGKEKDAVIERLKNPPKQDVENETDTVSSNIFDRYDPEQPDNYARQMMWRDPKTGNEYVVADGSFGLPRVGYILENRYILWEEYVRGNDYHGIFDTQSMRSIELDAGGYVCGIHDGFIYAMYPKYYWWYGGTPPAVFKTSLRNLNKAERLEHEGNLLEGLVDVDWSKEYTEDEALSPDYRYHAARTSLGVYVFDIQAKELVLHIPKEAIPGNNTVWREPDYGRIYGFSLCRVTFSNNKTLFVTADYINGYEEPYAIEIALP